MPRYLCPHHSNYGGFKTSQATSVGQFLNGHDYYILFTGATIDEITERHLNKSKEEKVVLAQERQVQLEQRQCVKELSKMSFHCKKETECVFLENKGIEDCR